LTDWFAEEYQTKSSASKRRKLNSEQEREEVHFKIKGFFRQFRKGDQFDAVRLSLSRSKSRGMNMASRSPSD